MISPTTPGLFWIGAANGGIWRSESDVYGKDGLDNDNDLEVDEEDEVWTGLYATDGFDNDGDGEEDEFDEVHWTPFVESLPSLSIGELQLDPSDNSNNALLDGIVFQPFADDELD